MVTGMLIRLTSVITAVPAMLASVLSMIRR
jgi:hypothetical protein